MRETAALVQNGSISDRIADALLRLDFFTFFHSCRVEKLAATIGRHLSLTSKEIMILKQGALLHDIGKLEVPSEILNKQDPLTPQEIALIQEHPIHGYDFARSIEMNDSVCRIILHHHIWANGEGGYPAGKNLRPCLLTQITTVADVVDAMTSERPYRTSLSITECIEYLESNTGKKYNPDVVQVVKQIISRMYNAV
ncbi:MAG TPA: HD domain-containing protein [Firmicutes bacterium]|nr:HD domain-containing protein [Bacillota bacterium]